MDETNEKERARQCLPARMIGDFDAIVNQSVLGASTHIKMIAAMMEAIGEDSVLHKESGAQLIARVTCLCSYFMSTRGEASQAVSNAIILMSKGIDTIQSKECSYIKDALMKSINAYLRVSKEDIDTTVKYAVEIAQRYNRILVYDYSSTIERVLTQIKNKVVVYIAESRVINGGYPFVASCIAAGHTIKFFPDASLMHFVKECEVAFMGAETITPDGTGYNTTGSDIVGLVCHHYKIPLYFVSPLIKLDMRTLTGYEKKLVINDLKSTLETVANPKGIDANIDYHTPELVGVESSFIRAFICEEGVIPAGQLLYTSLRYAEKIGGKSHV